MAQGNNSQKIFIMRVLELLVAKKRQYVEPVALKCNFVMTYIFLSSEIASGCWVLILMWDIYVICTCFWIVYLKLSLFLFWTHVLRLTCTTEIWQSLNIGWLDQVTLLAAFRSTCAVRLNNVIWNALFVAHFTANMTWLLEKPCSSPRIVWH